MLGFYNVGSLILGLFSWFLPFLKIGSPLIRQRIGSCILSFTCCSLALLFQILEIKHRVYLGDLSGLSDTIGAISVAAVVLIAITIFLNALAFQNKNGDN